MNIYDQLEKLATETNTPCVTISMNTHSIFPDNTNDIISLKNLVKEATERVNNDYEKKSVLPLLENIAQLENQIDPKNNLKSLSIYLSNDTFEYIQSEWSVVRDKVTIANTFSINALIKLFNRSEAYLILAISKNSINLYEALNNEIINEIVNEDLPISQNKYFTAHKDKNNDAKHSDDMLLDFFNKVDKMVQKVHNENGLKCVIIGTEDNYNRIVQTADNKDIYSGFHNIDYNNTALHQIAKQAWEIQQAQQHEQRTIAINEMKQAVSQGNVLTDLQDIYQAALDGRGDLLIVHEDFLQRVVMDTDKTFEIVSEESDQKNEEDISSKIAWLVISKKGRVIFTKQDEIKELGTIVLKTRY